MEYYIQGDAANADKINAAFKKLGYNTRGLNFSDGFFYTVERDVHYCIYDYMVNFIKTHPDYKELELPVEPKFKKGDWIACDADSFTLSIKSVKDGNYFFHQGASLPIKDIDEHYHLWAIEDAKDGDVLAAGDWVCIFRKIHINCFPKCHCHYDLTLEKFKVDTDSYMSCGVDIYPATKEQRDLLFAKMREAGFVWDADKKELHRIIEPQFKVGDSIVNDYCSGKVIEITNDAYLLDTGQGIPLSCEHNVHLWTIQDAKDGDVICTPNNNIFIYKCKGSGAQIYDYCGLYHGKFEPDSSSPNGAYNSCDGYAPATKEQRDLLFQKIKVAGYEWDAEKKELRKIQQHYDIKNFHAGMPVLVRDGECDDDWTYALFSHYNSNRGEYKFSASGDVFRQCIPFEGNEHLLGTTDMPSEEYINW